jgi:hypothetical protein
MAEVDHRISVVIETKRGKDSETWVHPEIAIDKQLLRRTLDLMSATFN